MVVLKLQQFQETLRNVLVPMLLGSSDDSPPPGGEGDLQGGGGGKVQADTPWAVRQVSEGQRRECDCTACLWEITKNEAGWLRFVKEESVTRLWK